MIALLIAWLVALGIHRIRRELRGGGELRRRGLQQLLQRRGRWKGEEDEA